MWRTDDVPILPFIKEYANHPNWKIRNVLTEIMEKLVGIYLKNMNFDNFEQDSIGEFLISRILIENDTRVRER